MVTKGQKVVEVAMGQLGVHESPWGSNCGGSQRFQAMYQWGLGRCSDGREGNWPWCGAFVGWCWEQVVAGSKKYSDPSTATMCSSKPNVQPQPGAAWVNCGTHVCILRYRISGDTWACVGGNESDQVSTSTRDLSGAQIVGPPWLGEQADGGEAAPDVEEERKWFFLQDVGAPRRAGGQRMYMGGWATDEAQNEQYKKVKDRYNHEFRQFKDGAFDSPFFLDNSAFVTEIYGGWESEASRDGAQDTLEARLDRALRPFSEMRTKAQAGKPWGCQNLEDP
jgi:hypothetical protein